MKCLDEPYAHVITAQAGIQTDRCLSFLRKQECTDNADVNMQHFHNR